MQGRTSPHHAPSSRLCTRLRLHRVDKLGGSRMFRAANSGSNSKSGRWLGDIQGAPGDCGVGGDVAEGRTAVHQPTVSFVLDMAASKNMWAFLEVIVVYDKGRYDSFLTEARRLP